MDVKDDFCCDCCSLALMACHGISEDEWERAAMDQASAEDLVFQVGFADGDRLP